MHWHQYFIIGATAKWLKCRRCIKNNLKVLIPEGDVQQKMEIQLQDSFKSYKRGVEKVCLPRKTLRRVLNAFNKLGSPVFLKAISIDRLDRVGIPVYVCKVNRKTKKVYDFIQEKTWGKGVDSDAAYASAVMEQVERFSCNKFLNDKTNFLIDTYPKIKKPKIEPEKFIATWPEKYKEHELVSNELRNTALHWAESFSLTRNERVYMPLRWAFMFHASNGMAAGNSLEEAILHGINEVVERHAIWNIIHRKILTPTIALDSIDNPFAIEMIKKFQLANIELYLKDFTVGFGIPTVGVIAHDKKTKKIFNKITITAGTSLNRGIALIRALIENAQVRSSFLYEILNVEKQTTRHDFNNFLQGLSISGMFPYYTNLKDIGFLVKNNKVVNFSDLPTFYNKNFKKEIEFSVKLISKKDLQVIVTNTTDEILKIPSVIVSITNTRAYFKIIHPYLVLIHYLYKTCEYEKAVRCMDKYFKLFPKEKKNPDTFWFYVQCLRKMETQSRSNVWSYANTMRA